MMAWSGTSRIYYNLSTSGEIRPCSILKSTYRQAKMPSLYTALSRTVIADNHRETRTSPAWNQYRIPLMVIVGVQTTKISGAIILSWDTRRK